MSETIYEALRESHETQRSLCRRLLRTRPAGDDRLRIFTALSVELAAHAASEERYLYAPLLMHDGGLDASRHALHEHHEIDELVEKLQQTSPSGRGWMNSARALSRQVHHHLREEEKKFFQVSGKLLTGSQKVRLARQYRQDVERMRRQLAAA